MKENKNRMKEEDKNAFWSANFTIYKYKTQTSKFTEDTIEYTYAYHSLECGVIYLIFV